MNVPPKMGRTRLYSDEQIIAALQAFYAKHGRAPYVREQRGMYYGVPGKALLAHRFGGLDRAYEIAGVPRNPQGGRAIHPGKMRHPKKPSMSIVPIDPRKAREITERKKAFWQNGTGSTWVHPYRKTA
jgi:hypothetical protein